MVSGYSFRPRAWALALAVASCVAFIALGNWQARRAEAKRALGAIMLVIIWLRVLRGHFKPDKHFAFEAVAWYWHFVDVVWLGLFFFVYWL